MNDIVLQLDPSPTNARNSEATFVTLKGDRILFIWSKFIGASDSDFGAGEIACKWSDDGGRTWSKNDRTLVKKDRKATNVMSPSALRLKDGRIALLYLRKEGHECVPFFMTSDDECETFSKPVQVILAAGYYVINNDRMVQLKSGRLILPVSICRWRGPWQVTKMDVLPGDEHTQYPRGLEPRFADPTIITHYFSDDCGKTWLESLQSYYVSLPDGSGAQEPGVIQLKDGRLWSWCRTGLIGLRGYRQWQSFSTDEGQHWDNPPTPSQFVSPCSPMQVKRIPKTGHLLAVWNDHSGHFKVPKPKPISWARTPLVSAISENEWKTWKHHKLLEKAPDHGFCYPAIHFVDDNVLLSYNAGGATSHKPLDTQRVRLVSLDWLYGPTLN